MRQSTYPRCEVRTEGNDIVTLIHAVQQIHQRKLDRRRLPKIGLHAIQRQGMAQPAMAGSQNQSTVCNSWDRQASGGGRNGMNAQAAQYQGLGAVMRRGRQMFGRKQVKTTPLSCDPHQAPVGAVPGGGGGATPTAHAELSQVPSGLQICPGPCDGGVQS